MKLIIAGSRNLSPTAEQIRSAFEKYQITESVTEVVSGGARGVDYQGEKFAQAQNLKLTVFPADWDRNGKAAGPIRNKQMADYADVLLLIWDGKSRGSANMKSQMKRLKKPVFEIILKKRTIPMSHKPFTPEERNDLFEYLHDAFTQACGVYDRDTQKYIYDHCCLSTWESIQRLLIKEGLIQAEDCRRL